MLTHFGNTGITHLDLGFRRHFADAILKKKMAGGEGSGVASGHLYKQDLAKLVSTLLL
jgi:hypothetical protein